MIPPGVWNGDERPPLACLGSLLWQSKGAIDASGKSFDAPGARDHSSEVFNQPADARDRAASWPRAFDGSGDVESVGERWALLAVAGGDRRRRTGGGALRQSQKQTGTPPPCRAGLARGPSRVEAQARHSADRLGRICRGQPRRLQLFAVLRTLSRLCSE